MTRVIDSASDTEDGDGTFAIKNPFSAHHEASVGVSTGQSDLSAAWDSRGFFSFLAEGQHTAAGSSDLLSRSTGRIWVMPQVDSILNITGEYDYMLADGIRDASLEGFVSRVADTHTIYGFLESRITLTSPPNGHISFGSGEIPLAAGVQYLLGYGLQLDSYSGSPTSLSQGDGFVRFDLAPVAEPSSLAMLGITAVLVLRRGRRGRIHAYPFEFRFR